MCLKYKQIFSLAAVLMISLVLFNVSWQENRGFVVREAQAVNVWGDWFSRTVGQKGFEDVGLGNKDPRTIIANVINILFGLLGVLAIVLIMYGGFIWMTASGDEDKINTAKAIIKNAAIGLLIILASFSIAIYVMSRLILATSGQKTQNFGKNGGPGSALGALGAGIIKSVYPAPEQREVPRNTSIIVTFRETMNADSICSEVVDGHCTANAKIKPDSVKIYKTDQGDNTDTNLNDTKVISTDNRTFVFIPSAYLGSPSEKLWYSVALTEKVLKAGGGSAFSLGVFQWKFEVSNKLDLTPPQVVSGGIFPAPDNARDTIGSVVDAKQAQGSITVKGLPQPARDNSVSYTPVNLPIDVSDPASNTCDGQIALSINPNATTANVVYNQMSGKVDDHQASIVNREIATACGFKIILQPGYVAGQSWVFTLTTQRVADYLLVGSNRYLFVDATPKSGEILLDNDINKLAGNIRNVLASDPNVSAEVAGAKVTLTARVAGKSGNGLLLMSSAPFNALSLSPMSGGTDKANIISVADRADKPKNAIIQINFDEAVNPLTIAGESSAVKDFIRVINLADGSRVAGEFILTNQYKTVEFVPANECGVNGCGDKIYCLPPNSNLRVELVAAALNATCATDADCAAKTPFTTCAGGVCTDSAKQAKYPEGRAGSGIADLANNSLDGNRNTKADGPATFFDANTNNVSEGDNFRWSFWISDALDISAPVIMATNVGQGDSNIDVDKGVEATFNKLMMATSLNSGTIEVAKGNEKITHKLINMWSVAQDPLGYWVEKSDRETSVPPDKEADVTKVVIKHGQLSMSSVYRAQIGSGVKDIYQNCYKPSSGPDCVANQTNPSCCLGTPGQTNAQGNCP